MTSRGPDDGSMSPVGHGVENERYSPLVPARTVSPMDVEPPALSERPGPMDEEPPSLSKRPSLEKSDSLRREELATEDDMMPPIPNRYHSLVDEEEDELMPRPRRKSRDFDDSDNDSLKPPTPSRDYADDDTLTDEEQDEILKVPKSRNSSIDDDDEDSIQPYKRDEDDPTKLYKSSSARLVYESSSEPPVLDISENRTDPELYLVPLGDFPREHDSKERLIEDIVKSQVGDSPRSFGDMPSEEEKKEIKDAQEENFTEATSLYASTAEPHDDDQMVITKLSKLSDEHNDKEETMSEVARKGRRKKFLIGAGVLVVVLALVLGLGLGLSSRGKEEALGPEPGNVEGFRELLYPISAETLDDPASPQSKALRWVSNEDERKTSKEVGMRYIAAVLYFSTKGERWEDQYNFLSDDSVCMWNNDNGGVYCTDNSISDLYLPLNNLSGTIPNEIGSLTDLRTIDMEDNLVTGTLPGSFADLGMLQKLDLRVNSLTGTLPDGLFSLGQIKEILVDGNDFSGAISPSLGQGPSLHTFWAFDSSLEGTIPASVGESSVLKSIDLAGNELTGTIPEFSSSSPMEALYLGFNDLVGSLPASVASLPMLAELSIAANEITGTIPDFASNAGLLRYVELWGNNLSGTVERFFRTTPTKNLEQIELSKNQLSGTLPSSMGQYFSMTDIIMSENLFTGTVPDSLAYLPNLETLLVFGNQFDDPEGMEEFCAEQLGVATIAVNACSGPQIECSCCNHCCYSSFKCAPL